jgi:hypothetical protein
VQTFLPTTEDRYGGNVRGEVEKVLAAMDLPDPEPGEYLPGAEANMLFLNRYGIILRLGQARNAPEHDLILRPLRSVEMEGRPAWNGRKCPVSITLLPGVEGVSRSTDKSDTLRDRLAVDGIDFWDSKLPNCGYIRCKLPGFENGILVVVDRGSVVEKERVEKHLEKQRAGLIPRFLTDIFNANGKPVVAARNRSPGLQEKVFAPFLDKLAECLPTSGWDGVKSFLYKCAGDIHQGENSIVTNQWNKNSDGVCGKPSDVSNMAKKYEARLKQRDHDRCEFYATLRSARANCREPRPKPSDLSRTAWPLFRRNRARTTPRWVQPARSSPQMPRRVGCHFRAVSAHLPTAPPPCALLAGVKEVQNAIAALADVISIKTGEQRCDAMRNRAKQVLRCARIKVRLGFEAIFSRRQPCPHRVLGHELVDLMNHPRLNIPAGFIFKDFLP